MSRHTKWIDDGNSWVCEKHLPSVIMPASSGVCAFSTCDSVRPKRESFNIGKAVSKPKPTPKPVPTTPKPTNVRKKKPTTPVKPETLTTPESTVDTGDLCSWFKCTRGENGTHAAARPKSKYCSRACSNANARFQHKQRKKDDE